MIHPLPFDEGAKRINHHGVRFAPAILKPHLSFIPDHCPLFIGGDHFISYQSIKRSRPKYVLWLDAHADFNSIETSPSGNKHGMVLNFLCQEGIIDPRNIFWFATRDIDEQERALMAPYIHQVSSDFCDLKYWLHTIKDALHVSFDVDFFDPSVAPATGTPVPNGASREDGLEIFKLLRHFTSSMDVVEFNPLLDIDRQTETLIIDCLRTFAGGNSD